MTMPRSWVQIRKPLLGFFLFMVLLGLWQWQLLRSLVQPQLVQAGLVTVSASPIVAPRFLYPELGISAPVTEAAWTSPLETQDWRQIREALTKGVSLAYEGDGFTAETFAFLTGHSSDVRSHAYSSVFAPLGQARLGQEFHLDLTQGDYRYRVVEIARLDPTQIDRFRQFDDGGTPRVALVTCWPPLTTNQRLVVVGERIES